MLSTYMQNEIAEVSKRHPNFVNDVRSPEFGEWLGLKSREFARLVESEDVYDANLVMDLFYKETRPSAFMWVAKFFR